MAKVVVVVPGQWREEGCFEDGFRSGAQDQHPGQARGAMQEPDLRRRCQPIREALGKHRFGHSYGTVPRASPLAGSKLLLNIISSRAREFNIIEAEDDNLIIAGSHILLPFPSPPRKMRQCIRSPGSAAIGAAAQMNIIAFPGNPTLPSSGNLDTSETAPSPENSLAILARTWSAPPAPNKLCTSTRRSLCVLSRLRFGFNMLNFTSISSSRWEHEEAAGQMVRGPTGQVFKGLDV